jgi:hypothetical protein
MILTTIVTIVITLGALYSINRYANLTLLKMVSDLLNKRDTVEKELTQSVEEHQKYLEELSALAVKEDENRVLLLQEELGKKAKELTAEYTVLDKAFRDSMKSDETLHLISCAYAVVGRNMGSRHIVDDELRDAVITHRKSLGNLPEEGKKLVGGLN